jgi:[ribosomal protein S5]-alanine N-acetyltransferase
MSARSAEIVAETLHTARLDLVPLDLDFCRAIVACDRDAAAEWLGADLGLWPNNDEIEGFFPTIIRGLREDSSAAGWLSRAIVVRLYGAVAGSAGMKGRPISGRVEVGWGLEPPYRGQGYAREAARAILGYAFAHREVDEVIARIDVKNAASIAVAEAIGMRHLAGQPLLWGVTRAEFEQR